jgi:hypothetical protein
MSADKSDAFFAELDNDEMAAMAGKIDDLALPGFMVEMTPEEADAMGAFEETALTEQDAIDAAADDEIGDDNGGQV